MAKNVIVNLKIDTKEGVKSIGDVNNEMTTTLSTMREMEEAADAINEALKDTEVGTEEYEKLAKELIKVNTELKNQELALEALDHEQVASEIKSVAGGLTDMAAGFTLVGVSGQSMEKIVQTMAKVEGISKLVTGAIEGYQSAMKLTGTVTAFLTAWQTKLAVAQAGTGASAVAASVGMKILNAVMSLNPVFLLIAGIGALIAAFALFGGESESAAESAQKLNDALEEQLQRMQALARFSKLASDIRLKQVELENEATREQIQLDIDLLESKTVKTQEETDKLIALRTKLHDHNKAATQSEFDEVLDQFDREEVLNANKLTSLKERQKNILKVISTTSGEEQAAAQQTHDEIIQQIQEVTDLTATSASRRVNLINEWKLRATKIENERVRDLDRIEQKQADERRKRAEERRKALLTEINDILARMKSAGDELESARIANIENLEEKELELQDLQFGAAKDKLIEGATKREIAALEAKFLSFQLTEEQFMEQRKAIVENGVDNLLDIEAELLTQMEADNKKALAIIKQRFVDTANLTKAETDVINSNRLLAEVQYQKELELVQASSIKDNKERELKIKSIKEKFLQAEIDAIRANQLEEQELRTETYLQDINQKGITNEEKKKLDAQYTADSVALQNDANMQIALLEAEAHQLTVDKRAESLEQITIYVNAIASMVQETMNTIQMALDQQAENAAAQRQNEYDAEAEHLNAAYANREISQKQFDNKMEVLEQKKRQKELAAKRKAFKQQKAMAIVSAVMGTAQGVVQGLANPFPLNIIMAALAGVLGAVQIGIISSQKFHAARGGKVPGLGPKHIDSVEAMLAPGETVINSESSEMFPGLLSEINKAGGGISLAPEPIQNAVTQSSNNVDEAFKENRKQPMVKAYVVETEITDAQRRIDRIERAAEFGNEDS